MEPWYKAVELRKEVREGRSFNPDEFAIHLEQVVAKTAPEDYRDPVKFFSRTCFTKALVEHLGLVLRRLSGRSEHSAPVMTLITQFGGGKTHTLTSLYHLANAGPRAAQLTGIPELLKQAEISEVPAAKVAIFVGNAWDPQEGAETPWIDVARQLAGDAGVAALGTDARTSPPGTKALGDVFAAAGGTVLILFDEVLNFMNRHRRMAEPFHAFIQNLTGATTGAKRGAAVISLPRSQVEMTDWDYQWQEKITKVVRRVAKDLIANDEAEIGEVVRRRLFENLGSERNRKNVAKDYADWCFERRAQLPPEWTRVDTASTEASAKEFLRSRFESCFPFHPATLSVFQRKWQALPQYQQTRGTLAMLAQWISWAYQDGFHKARKEPLLTLGSAPLEDMAFRSAVLGQLGESRLVAAIDADISGAHSHARALDADTHGPLQDIHRRVATVILFESSGGQIDKLAHLPELRFALGEPAIDTTSVDNAALLLESKAYFIRKLGTDGFRIHHKPTLKKVVNDRKASLDENDETKPTIRKIVEKVFRNAASLAVEPWPESSDAVPDSPRLTLVLMNPEHEWSGSAEDRKLVAEWTRKRGRVDRSYPGALVWCFKKPGRELRDKVEAMLAWKRVAKEVQDGTLGADFDRTERTDVQAEVTLAEEAAIEEVWATYRFAIVADAEEPDGLNVIDLGAGHSSGSETLCGRIVTALKGKALLNESVGAGYLERHWPQALKESGAWPLKSLRQCFLNGSFTRLIDPDAILRTKITDFVIKGELGLASGRKDDGSYERVWFDEPVIIDEVTFDPDVYLLTKPAAERAKAPQVPPAPGERDNDAPGLDVVPDRPTGAEADVAGVVTAPADRTVAPPSEPQEATLRLTGTVPPEVWNRIGTKLIPKLRSATELKVSVDIEATCPANFAASFTAELRRILEELGIANSVRIE
jgi:hypothetical protein